MPDPEVELTGDTETLAPPEVGDEEGGLADRGDWAQRRAEDELSEPEKTPDDIERWESTQIPSAQTRGTVGGEVVGVLRGAVRERDESIQDILYEGESMRAALGESFGTFRNDLTERGTAYLDGPTIDGVHWYSVTRYNAATGEVVTHFYQEKVRDWQPEAETADPTEQLEDGVRERSSTELVVETPSAETAEADRTGAAAAWRMWEVRLDRFMTPTREQTGVGQDGPAVTERFAEQGTAPESDIPYTREAAPGTAASQETREREEFVPDSEPPVNDQALPEVPSEVREELLKHPMPAAETPSQRKGFWAKFEEPLRAPTGRQNPFGADERRAANGFFRPDRPLQPLPPPVRVLPPRPALRPPAPTVRRPREVIERTLIRESWRRERAPTRPRPARSPSRPSVPRPPREGGKKSLTPVERRLRRVWSRRTARPEAMHRRRPRPPRERLRLGRRSRRQKNPRAGKHTQRLRTRRSSRRPGLRSGRRRFLQKP